MSTRPDPREPDPPPSTRWPAVRLDDTRGSMAVVFGLALGVLAVLGIGAADIASWVNRKAELQNAVDSAALTVARNIAVGALPEEGVSEAVATMINAALAADEALLSRHVASSVSGNDTLSVVVEESRRFMLSSFWPKATIDLSVSAAVRYEPGRICVIALEERQSGAVSLTGEAKATANGCTIHSNSRSRHGVASEERARLASSRHLCSGGGYAGGEANYSGVRRTDCPAHADPLASRQPPPIGACTERNLRIRENRTLSPGTYCGGLILEGDIDVALQPGIYVVRDGPLIVRDGVRLAGRHVGFFLTGQNARFEFETDTRVALEAPRDGPMAGVLFWSDLDQRAERLSRISSNFANRLVGAIYLPRGTLIVDADAPVADLSAWTAVIVRQLVMSGRPHLVVNANYHATDVPVPGGIISESVLRLVR